MTTTHSFTLGYRYGRRPSAMDLSTKEILTRWPTVNPVAFAQGMVDGLAHDSWRLRHLIARQADERKE